MADFLTHIFLPLSAAYVIKPEIFDSPLYIGLGLFGLLSDFDKFLGYPGLLHSLITLIPVCLGILWIEHWRKGEILHSPILVFLILSHLVLDLLEGGPVTLFYPIIDAGIGLEYPIRTVFGEGPLGVSFHGPPIKIRIESPKPGHNVYGFMKGVGLANMLLFAIIYTSRNKYYNPQS